MGEAFALARSVVIIGVMILFAQMLYGDEGPANFTNLSSLPVLDNPFDHGLEFSFGLDNGGEGYNDSSWGTAFGTNHSCSQSAYWNCVIDPNGPDFNDTYWQNAVGGGLVLNTTGWPTSGRVRYGTLTISCRSNATEPTQMAALLNGWIPSTGGSSTGYLQSLGENVYCRTGTQFTTQILHLGLITGATEPTDLSVNPIPPNLQLEIFGNVGSTSEEVQFSTVKFTAFVSNPGQCLGGDFFTNLGCSFANAAAFWTNVGILIVNGIVFVFAWAFFIGQFFVDVGAALAWFYHIPDIPAWAQGIIALPVTGIYFLFGYSMARLIRGSGPV